MPLALRRPSSKHKTARGERPCARLVGFCSSYEAIWRKRAGASNDLCTLYGTIKRLLEACMIEESDERPDPELDDERRRYYRLTAIGQRAVKAEALRYAAMAEVARRKRLIGKPVEAARAGVLP